MAVNWLQNRLITNNELLSLTVNDKKANSNKTHGINICETVKARTIISTGFVNRHFDYAEKKRSIIIIFTCFTFVDRRASVLQIFGTAQ